ncbi:MAG: esterase-like activity of phytase family protein [Mobilicoccus sp.]|nr:esterase-like activity of phytase family protein [Mobilicoccus sp.]
MTPRPRLSLVLALALPLTAAAGYAPAHAAVAPAPTAVTKEADRKGVATLTKRSILPAETYTPNSEPSGHFVTGNAKIPAPFTGQPVQGFSATHRLGDGSYLVMSDNGFGTKANSPDYQLAVHRIRPTAGTDGKPGATQYLNTVFTLSDPDGLIPWDIWRDGACAAASDKPVNYTCPGADRILTGWDFDLESMQVANDGTFWFGEEFGPFLLHTDQLGRLLSPPIPTPGVRAPENPTLRSGQEPNLGRSKGFEGMAISPDGHTLYPMLEGPLAEDVAAGRGADLRIYEVSIKNRARYTGAQWRYRMESTEHAIGDFIAVNDHQFLVIERDNKQGAEATFKKIYLVDMVGVKRGEYVRKTLVADLMNIADPNNVGGMGGTFTFPFFTIENVEIIDANTISVMNDNNFPAMGGRGPEIPDENEYIALHLDTPLKVDERLLGKFVPYGPQTAKGKGKKGKAAATISLIGDVPYGQAQVEKFPGWVDDINAGKTDLTIHVGDIKNGSSVCSDEYFSMIKTQFDRFAQPLIYSPGDNEWTDCHRPNNGAYNPLERLDKIREVFFAKPDVTNGTPMAIRSQAAQGFPENVQLRKHGISLAAVHVVGSNDSLAPWTGKTAPTAEQAAEQKARMANALSVVSSTFEQARRHGDRAVVIALQADMFDPTSEFTLENNDAFIPFIQKLVDESSSFSGHVYLLDGDSHVFHVDQPLESGSPWLARYGITGSADNLTRITTDGSANNTNWIKMTVNRTGEPLSFVQVPYSRF